MSGDTLAALLGSVLGTVLGWSLLGVAVRAILTGRLITRVTHDEHIAVLQAQIDRLKDAEVTLSKANAELNLEQSQTLRAILNSREAPARPQQGRQRNGRA